MRALLFNPWIYDFAAYDLWSKPIGLLNIAAHLKRSGCEIGFIDCLDRLNPRLVKFFNGRQARSTTFGSGAYYSQIINKPSVFDNVQRRFKRYGLPLGLVKSMLNVEPRPDVILVTSGMTYWYPGVFDAVKMLKDVFPEVPLILGGIYANLCFAHARKNSKADYVYKGNNINEILGLIAKLTGKELDYSRAKDLERVFPLYDLYEKLSYITLRTSNGCPFRCTYCGWYILENTLSRQDPYCAADEIEYFYRRYSVKNYAFYDEALLCDAERHIAVILEELLKRKIRVNFHTPGGLHARFIDAQLARLLKKSGFIRPRLGFETSSGERQRETGAKTTNKELLRTFGYLTKAGYPSRDIGIYVIAGLPGQPLDEVKESIEFIGSLKARIYLEEYSPVPGTPDFARSGLTEDSDPLAHNNSVFSINNTGDSSKLQGLKDLVHKFNGL